MYIRICDCLLFFCIFCQHKNHAKNTLKLNDRVELISIIYKFSQRRAENSIARPNCSSGCSSRRKRDRSKQDQLTVHISCCQKDQLTVYIGVRDCLFFSCVQGTRPKVAVAAAMHIGSKGLFCVIRVNSYKCRDLVVTYCFVSNLLIHLLQHSQWGFLVFFFFFRPLLLVPSLLVLDLSILDHPLDSASLEMVRFY